MKLPCGCPLANVSKSASLRITNSMSVPASIGVKEITSPNSRFAPVGGRGGPEFSLGTLWSGVARGPLLVELSAGARGLEPTEDALRTLDPQLVADRAQDEVVATHKIRDG